MRPVHFDKAAILARIDREQPEIEAIHRAQGMSENELTMQLAYLPMLRAYVSWHCDVVNAGIGHEEAAEFFGFMLADLARQLVNAGTCSCVAPRMLNAFTKHFAANMANPDAGAIHKQVFTGTVGGRA